MSQALAPPMPVLSALPVATPAGRLRRADMALAFALAVLLDLMVGGRMLPGVLAGGLVNPDSYMRLVRLEAILAEGRLLDTVLRDGAGQGTQIHWSHLIDALLLLLALPLRPFMDPAAALHAVAAAWGPLSMGALGIAVAWAAAPLAARRHLWFAPLAAGLSPSIAAYGIPGVLHHHLPLMVVAVALGGWAFRAAQAQPRPGAGLALGAWAALGLWFSPETMPFILMAFGLVWLAWLEAPAGGPAGAMVRQSGFALLAVLALIFAIDPPQADGRWAAVADRVSVVHLAMAAATAAAAVLTWQLDRLRLAPRPRLAAGCAAGGACIGAWLAAFPGLLGGAEGLLDDETARLFFGGIAEMQPVRGLPDLLTYLFGGGLAAAALAWFAARSRSLTLIAAALAALALLLFSLQHIRFSSYPACLAAVLLPIVLTRLTIALADAPEARMALARVGAIALFVLVPQIGNALGTAADDPVAGSPGAACPAAGAVALLAPHAGQVVLTDVNDVPELLYRTSIRTVGSLYHRSPHNFLRLRAAWRSEPARDGRAGLDATGADLVLHCPRPRRPAIVADIRGETLLDVLSAGRPPAWLAEIGRAPSGHILYRVIR